MKKFRGVTYNRYSNKYQGVITRNKIRYDCGLHATEQEAAKAIDRKILEKGLKAELQVLKPVKKE